MKMIAKIRVGILQKKSEIDPSTHLASYDCVASCTILCNDDVYTALKLHGLDEEQIMVDLAKAMYDDLLNNCNKKFDSVGIWLTLRDDNNTIIENALDIKTLDSIENNREELNGFEEFVRLTYKNIQ